LDDIPLFAEKWRKGERGKGGGKELSGLRDLKRFKEI